ncbi:interferon-related developmental regulator 1-like [Plakobranchus ocellatus]|uniref:Interferon-related developmental regulator 1-like n=1 Tax=Plakobranchus ocellatus TaxID=259542 RepID=A0AAV4CBV7_9GAST|nr:interferon-related developmental regulator 1-like [Plakobranchus ocellatus]
MPKKNLKKRAGGRATEGAAIPLPRPRNDDEESIADNWSTQSVASDDTSWPGSDPVTGDEAEDTSEQDNFEDSFNDCLDGTLQKSANARITALQGIQKALQKKYVADFLWDRKETLTDNVLRCLKKGKGNEQAIAASCLSLLALQIGPEAEGVFTTSQPYLTTLMADNATPVSVRGACALSLAAMCFVCCDGYETIKAIAKTLEDIFCLGYGKGENSPTVSPDQSWLMSQALSAWCLLLTIAPAYDVQRHVEKHLGSLQDLLRSSDVDLRMTAGEAVALLYELARENDEDFEDEENEVALCELLKQLATDSVKHRAKKDRRQQRSCFRDVQRFVVDSESPSETVKVGKENLLELSSWSQKRQYDALCAVLMTGMSTHLRANPLLRDIFDLGAPGLDEYSHTKALTKAQRTFINAAAFKKRTKARAKHRDKRTVTVNGY